MAEFTASRREVMAASGFALAGWMLPSQATAAASADPATLARDAVVWSVPLILTGRYLEIAANAGVPLNRLVLSPDLATPATRALGAQVDTLYGLGWLDLADGPLVIEVPDTHDRYYAIQLIDAWGNASPISAGARPAPGPAPGRSRRRASPASCRGA